MITGSGGEDMDRGDASEVLIIEEKVDEPAAAAHFIPI